MKRKTFFISKKLGLLSILMSLGLVACSAEPYPYSIQQELLSYCKDGIHSGLLVVHHGKNKRMTEEEINQLCQFRLNAFMKQVALDKYLTLNKNIYENFRRAYAHKYVLADIYDTLSPDDKAVNAKIATIILGLESNNAK